ncbi:lantibiotic dehydratase C-terminal domain-containing protein [Algibacter sp. 2305UL17-15]|uniref:lantibiotic dehydratase C-terminal domain-containing protein n=1 Tax=Algibacter sp. 2305UL17-15 TaxID=3231268 RepID=UPI003457AFDC
MKKDKTLYLCISLFYHREFWHKLLIEGISPFLSEQKNGIKGYYISLSHLRGDHIRLSLITEKSNAKTVARKADAYFKTYFKNYPSPNLNDLKREGSIFLDFQNNTVHYGVYNFSVGTDDMALSELFKDYQENLTKVLLEVFQFYKEETLHNMVEIMIQCYAIFRNSASLDIGKTLEFFDALLQEEYVKYNDKALSRILEVNKSNFESNKTFIIEHLAENIEKSNKGYDEKWENSWSNTVKVLSENVSKSSFKKEEHRVHIHMLKQLNDTFDINDRITAYYLFYNGLKAIQNTSTHP